MWNKRAGAPLRAVATLAITAGLVLHGGAAFAEPGTDISNPEPLMSSEALAQQQVQAESSPTAAAPLAGGIASASDEARIFTLVNEARIRECSPILDRNPKIDTVARDWSQYLDAKNILEHNPRYHEQIPQGWLMAGENAASGHHSGDAMFTGWMNSPGHKENILNPGFTDIGIGFVRSGGQYGFGTKGTQVFASYPENLEGRFLDVRPWTKFYKEIEWMGQAGLTTGVKVPGCKSGATYQPKDVTTREAMAAFIYRMEGAKYRGPATSPFADVQPGHKFYDQISWMHHMGYSTGVKQKTGKPNYQPKAAVSREAMAAFMYRVAEATDSGAGNTPFVDVPFNDKFYREITWMYTSGLSTGTKQAVGKPKYQPKSPVTREAMAAFIYRLKKS